MVQTAGEVPVNADKLFAKYWQTFRETPADFLQNTS
jgi:hypothetical protein